MKDLKIFTEDIEYQAIEQIYTLANQPAFENAKIRIMPDVHAGAGCVIGFTANLGEKVIPNIVGVDIGCGMRVVCLGNIHIDFQNLDNIIRKYVPSGRLVHDFFNVSDDFIKLIYCHNMLHDIDRIKGSIGTLGGGNHFIEVDEDKNENKYLVIHTGSRNLGKQVADIYQDIAIKKCKSRRDEISELIRKLKSEGKQREISSELDKFKKSGPKVPKELSYLEGEDREKYLHDMKICQEFAVMNRKYIANIICKYMRWEQNDCWESVHNYIDDENMVRKGSISARNGEKVIIPLNMRDGCILGYGKGNEDWNFSAPHGAGRSMSRSAAKDQVSMNDYEKSMQGIFTTSVCTGTIDESPMAYKNSNEIISSIYPTVDIIDVIKPIYNFKASD